MSTPDHPAQPGQPEPWDPTTPTTPTPAGPPPPPSGDAAYGTVPSSAGSAAYGADQPAYGQPVGYGAGPSAYGQPGYGGPAAPAGRNGLAIAALVLGILAVLGCWIPFVNIGSILLGIVAVVLGALALRKIKKTGQTGRGMGITGLVLGAISVIASIGILVATIVAIANNDELGDAIDEALASASALPTSEVTPDVTPEPSDDAVAPTDDAATALPPAGFGPFTDIDCPQVADEAVAISAGEAVTLTGVTDPAIVEDHRTDYATPSGTDETLVLSCRGTAAWSDATSTSVLLELTVDGNGDLYVAYSEE